MSGAYFSGKPGVDEFKPISPSDEASNEEVGDKLWTLTTKLVADYL